MATSGYRTGGAASSTTEAAVGATASGGSPEEATPGKTACGCVGTIGEVPAGTEGSDDARGIGTMLGQSTKNSKSSWTGEEVPS